VPRVKASIGIVVERRRLASPWAEFAWAPVQALPGEPAASPWTMLSETSVAAHFYAGQAEIELFRTETAHYRDNLLSERPCLWVLLRTSVGDPPVELVAATANPAEGEAYTEAGQDIVEPVPMPPEVQAWLAGFVGEHHVEQPFFKRRRDAPDLEALGRRAADHDDE
jgi:hypothetical protein